MLDRSEALKEILKLIAIGAVIITITFGGLFFVQVRYIEQFMDEYNADMASVEDQPVLTGRIDAHFEREHVRSRFFTDTITHTQHIEVDGVEHDIDVALWSKLEKGQEIEYQITDKGRIVNIKPAQKTGLSEPRSVNQLTDAN